MRLKKLTLTAVLTAAALVMFVLESQLPPLTAIPGIKPGLSNIFTLFTMETLGRLGFRAVFHARHARLRHHRAGFRVFVQLRGRALRVCADAAAQEADSGQHALGQERAVRHDAQRRTTGRRCGHREDRRGMELICRF